MQSYVTISDKAWIETTQNSLERSVSIWSEQQLNKENTLRIGQARGFIALLSFRAVLKDSISVTLSMRDARLIRSLLGS